MPSDNLWNSQLGIDKIVTAVFLSDWTFDLHGVQIVTSYTINKYHDQGQMSEFGSS